MKILDTETGRIHEYGTNQHDSLAVSNDGRYLCYYNLQCGDGSKYGTYLFVCDDNKVPAESETAAAIHAEVYFNIGGWDESRKKPEAEWFKYSRRLDDGLISSFYRCSSCRYVESYESNFCANCGKKMKKGVFI